MGERREVLGQVSIQNPRARREEGILVQASLEYKGPNQNQNFPLANDLEENLHC